MVECLVGRLLAWRGGEIVGYFLGCLFGRGWIIRWLVEGRHGWLLGAVVAWLLASLLVW